MCFSNLLRKDWDERLEDDKLILERILILVRNVLQVPTNVRAEQRADGMIKFLAYRYLYNFFFYRRLL
jgi:hypothetical protein